MFNKLSQITDFIAPIDKKESPSWFYRWGRLILALTLLALPFTYDIAVPEVAGDPRWYLMQFSSGLLLLLWTIKQWQQGSGLDTRWPLTSWLTLGLVTWTIVSFIDTFSPLRGWFFFKHFMGYIGLFAFMYILRHHLWFRHLCWLLIIPIAFNTLLATIQFFDLTDATISNLFPLWQHIGFIDAWRAGFPQSAPPAGTFANKNLLASWLVLLTPLTLWFLVTSRHKALQILSAILLALAGSTLLYTRSRASWVAALFTIVLLIAWLAINPAQRRLLIARLKPFTLILMAIAAGFIALSGQFTSPLRGVHSVDKSVAEQFSSLVAVDSERAVKDFGPRMAYNLNGLHMVRDHWLNGVGIGGFHAAYPLYHDAAMPTPYHGYNMAARPQRAHNDVMQTFIELGIPGGLLLLFIALTVPWMTWQLGRGETAEKAGLLPVFLMVGIAGLGVNALLDFPLQMPTAPGTMWALIGMLTGLYALYHPTALHGPQPALALPKWLWGAIALVALISWVGVSYDNYLRRTAAQDLKIAMSLTMSGIFNDHTLNFINNTHNTYPYNQRAREFRAVIYSNYSGSRSLSTASKEQVVREALESDPYAANNLVNLAGLLFRRIQQLQLAGQTAEANRLTTEMRQIVDKLYIVGPKNAHTWGIAGLLALLENKPDTALKQFENALEIDPNYSPAQTGRLMAQQQIRLQQQEQGYPFENLDPQNRGQLRIPLNQLIPQLEEKLNQQ